MGYNALTKLPGLQAGPGGAAWDDDGIAANGTIYDDLAEQWIIQEGYGIVPTTRPGSAGAVFSSLSGGVQPDLSAAAEATARTQLRQAYPKLPAAWVDSISARIYKKLRLAWGARTDPGFNAARASLAATHRFLVAQGWVWDEAAPSTRVHPSQWKYDDGRLVFPGMKGPIAGGLGPCNGQYPAAGQKCGWALPNGTGVILNGPPGVPGRSFPPCPAGYVPDPATGECVAATDALWQLYYPASQGGGGGTGVQGPIQGPPGTPQVLPPGGGGVVVAPPPIQTPQTGGGTPGTATPPAPTVPNPTPLDLTPPRPPVDPFNPPATAVPGVTGSVAPFPGMPSASPASPVAPTTTGRILALVVVGAILYLLTKGGKS